MQGYRERSLRRSSGIYLAQERKERTMFLLEFGGHPVLHHYNYIMYRRRREELMQEAEHERLVRAARLQQRRKGGSHLKYAGWLGDRLISLGLKLERFGTLSQARPTPSASPHH